MSLQKEEGDLQNKCMSGINTWKSTYKYSVEQTEHNKCHHLKYTGLAKKFIRVFPNELFDQPNTYIKGK